jgi:hypothetical protein
MEGITQPSAASRVDGNGDGQFTISEAASWLQQAFFLPGDWLIWALATYAPAPAEYLEIGAGDYSGVLSGFLSVLAWLGLIIIACITFAALRDFDHALTNRIERLYAEALRRFRVARALLAYRIRRTRKAPASTEPIEFADEINLAAEELRVLQLHGGVQPGYALSISEIAASLKLPRDRVRKVAGRLKQLQLLDSTVGGREGESAYRLTRAGRAFLVFRQIEPGHAPAVQRAADQAGISSLSAR